MKTERKLKRKISSLKKYIFKLEQHIKTFIKVIKKLKENTIKKELVALIEEYEEVQNIDLLLCELKKLGDK